jgi:hypothetical protein
VIDLLRAGGRHRYYSRQTAWRRANNSPKTQRHREKNCALFASQSSSAVVSSANRKARWESGWTPTVPRTLGRLLFPLRRIFCYPQGCVRSHVWVFGQYGEKKGNEVQKVIGTSPVSAKDRDWMGKKACVIIREAEYQVNTPHKHGKFHLKAQNAIEQIFGMVGSVP